MTPKAVSTWTKLASLLLLILAGIAFAAAVLPPVAGAANLFLDLVLWPLDGAQAVTTPEARVLAAIGGGIALGWGVLIWQVAEKVLPNDPRLGRALIAPAIASWFMVDSTASLLAGSPVNAMINVLLLAAFLVPLWLMKA
jgi:hypothetical protein